MGPTLHSSFPDCISRPLAARVAQLARHDLQLAMSIRQLPDHAIDKLRSSIVITSLNSVVVGLVKNSLDAGATKVNITIEFARGNCMVEDDGSGILPSEFDSGGGLAKFHHTSKFPPSDQIHGRHGDFLASLATFSLLLISACHRQHVSHNSLMVHNSKLISRHTPAPPEHKLRAFEHGTRVVVRNLFGSLPVRVKHRAILFSERQNVDKHWWELVHDVVAVLLSCVSGISLSLKDLTTQRELRLRSLDAPDVFLRSSRIISQAFLSNSRDDGTWLPISASSGSVSLKGCISTQPAASRRCQFISLGIEPVDNKEGVNVLYEEVNRVFKNSDFGALSTATEHVGPGEPAPATAQATTKKGLERWPMFFFQIRGASSPGESPDVDALLSGSRPKDLGTVLNLVKAVSYGFLKKHNYRPGKIKIAGQSVSKSTKKRSDQLSLSLRHREVSRPESPGCPSTLGSAPGTESRNLFDDWSRVKVGHAKHISQKERADGQAKTPLNSAQATPLIASDGRLLRKPFEEMDMLMAEQDSPKRNFNDEPEKPKSNYFNVEAGNSSPTRCSPTHREASHKHVASSSKKQPSEWLKGVLETWENPVFENVPAAIPRAYDDHSTQLQQGQPGERSRHFGGTHRADEIMLQSSLIGLAGRVSKMALPRAEVISQVDRKFILVKLPLESINRGSREVESSALVILDQHAVDERCQLESLMADYFVPSSRDDAFVEAKTESLDPPLRFEVTLEERRMLEHQRTYFAAWGISVDVGPEAGPASNANGRSQESSPYVTVTSLPPSIAARCRAEPRMAIDLLRTECWRRADGGQSAFSVFPKPTEGSSPVSNFHGCPRGILELLHSRSCRSAIMFNDALTRGECVALLAKLSLCAFPFQCAHGRPSMAPLVDLGTGTTVGGWNKDRHVLSMSTWEKYHDC